MIHTSKLLGVCALICGILIASLRADESRPMPGPYATARDAALEANESVNEEKDDHTRLRVEFNGIKGDRVPGFLYVPKGSEAKHPAVLLQYGSGGNKSTDYIVALGHQFVSHGFVVLTIDSVGRGERKSKEKRSTDWFFSNEGRQTFLQYCGDYSRAVDYLVSRSDVDPERIAYVGISWGAITGVTYVAHDPRIKVMGSMVGGGNFMGVLGSKAPEEVKDSPPPIDPVYHVGKIAPRPLLMLNVTKDLLVPRPFAEALHKAAGEGSKVQWLETDHYFSGVDHHELGESVIQFIRDNFPGM